VAKSSSSAPAIVTARCRFWTIHLALVLRDVLDDLLAAVATSPWSLPLLFALVFGDAFLVVIPGEAAVTALAALSVVHGRPPIAGVVAVAAIAAFSGDAACYTIGRTVGVDRWKWSQAPRVVGMRAWAKRRLARSTAAIVFTARFIPFARIAVNLTAGAERLPAPRYLGLCALAAGAWATYQSFIGAAIASLFPGSPVAAVVISVAVALLVGWALDALLSRRVAPDDR
jgi:membrane-associated protein